MKHKLNPLNHKISFETAGILHITLETERLVIQSVTPENENDCVQLFGDPIVMKKFNTGVPYQEERTKARVSVWTNRWKNHDPFSMFSIFEKKSGEFMGLVGIQHSAPGESEVCYALHHRFWGNGFGSEANDAVIQSLIPRLMLRGYRIDHAPLKKIIATARLDNPASQQILKGAGFKEEEVSERFGVPRQFFCIYSKQLRNDYQNFFLNKHKPIDYQEPCEITNEEMMNSTFGQQSSTAKKGNRYVK